ncbi:YqjF family protein [Leptospira alstonii]|uniref:YqjF family protein n=1 Tax=Leptospira alstonii TaxID=28452 RepID=UPI0007736756|nr:DUF2071 domain-containing protein [Leptospira alstonii]
MNKKNKLANDSPFRLWNIPERSWLWYQEWNRAIFIHIKIDPDLLVPLIPIGLEIDKYEGETWLSIVAFSMENVHPKGFFPFPPVSNFHEVNVRTYVVKDNKPGVYFLSIEAEKLIPVILAKYLSGLPYKKSSIIRKVGPIEEYFVKNYRNSLTIKYKVKNPLNSKSALDIWLTERYCLYNAYCKKLVRLEIQHRPWPLLEIDIDSIQFNYKIGEKILTNNPIGLVHYSPGVSVQAWNEEIL